MNMNPPFFSREKVETITFPAEDRRTHCFILLRLSITDSFPIPAVTNEFSGLEPLALTLVRVRPKIGFQEHVPSP